jgi:hypothetical protein
MLIRRIMLAVLFAGVATAADAQGITYVNPTVPGVPFCFNCNAGTFPAGAVDVGSSLVKISTFNVGPMNGQPFNQESIGYVSLASLLGSNSQVNARIDTAFAAIDATNTRVTALNNQINRAFEVTAIAAAMGDAIPNPGDRFAIRLNAAALNGAAAGAFGFSYNLNDTARVSVNYGQGRTQSVVSGGLNLSFR